MAARNFLARAWAVLEEERVLPASRYRFHLRVGHDYFGDLDNSAFEELEAAIQAAYPRFAGTVPMSERAYAATYIYGFLQVCIARLTRDGNGVLEFGPIVDGCLADLHVALAAESTGLACLRMTSHLQTHDGKSLTLAGLTLRPLRGESYSWRQQVVEIFDAAMFGAGQLVEETAPFVYAPPECIIAAQGKGPEGSVDVALSKRISAFLMAVRLLTAGTCHSVYEVRGGTQPVTSNPQLHLFRGALPDSGSQTSMLRRVASLSAADEGRIGGLQTLMEAARKPQQDMVFTSIGMAAERFTVSFHAHDWSEQIVDLATAFEAALSGVDKQDVLLRLRTRATALLATDKDPAGAIFKDIGLLYQLRSALVHGGTMSTKTLRKIIQPLSTVPPDAPMGLAVAYAVDRLRDLVRRTLLARFALAGGDSPLWPLNRDDGVDAHLADDTTRAQWRQAWRAELASIDAAAAIDAPAGAVWAVRPLEAAE